MGAVSGPGGEITNPNGTAFDPSTYLPPDIAKSAKAAGGRDPENPTQVPARLFRRSTYLVATLWFLGVLPQEVFNQWVAKPLMTDIIIQQVDTATGELTGGEVRMAVGSDVNGLPELIPVKMRQRNIPELEGDVRVYVRWPSQSAFVPRSFSCEPAGKYLVMGDDFGLYLGEMTGMEEDTEAGKPKAGRTEKKLRVSFQEAPECVAMEGETLQDIAVFCDESDGSKCVVFALHDGGQRVTLCPLEQPTGAWKASGSPGPDAKSWTIAQEWLSVSHSERVKSIAISSSCVPSNPSRKFSMSTDCLVVGTTRGRVIDLQSSIDGDSMLVPSHVLLQRGDPSSGGSLANIGGGLVLVLWFQRGVVSAVDVKGSMVGEWKLPEGLVWLMICANSNHIFALGVRGSLEEVASEKTEGNDEEEEGEGEGEEAGEGRRLQQYDEAPASPDQGGKVIELYRFDLPETLKQRLQKEAEG